MQPIDERNESMAEAIRAALDGQANNIRVALPGVIEQFDEQTQTATVQVALRESILQEGVVEDIEIPLLPDVPVYFPGGSDYNITYPIEAGMECLVIFSDMCIDAWWESGGIQNQTENRRHDLSDGFALVGFRSQTTIPKCYKNDAIVIQAFQSTIELSKENIQTTSENVDIKAEQSFTMNTKNASIQADTIIIDGELIINGQAYKDHKHSGVEAGGSSTGGIV